MTLGRQTVVRITKSFARIFWGFVRIWNIYVRLIIHVVCLFPLTCSLCCLPSLPSHGVSELTFNVVLNWTVGRPIHTKCITCLIVPVQIWSYCPIESSGFQFSCQWMGVLWSVCHVCFELWVCVLWCDGGRFCDGGRVYCDGGRCSVMEQVHVMVGGVL